MSLTKTFIEYDGLQYSLRTWCAANYASYEKALARWHAGVRDPVELLYGKKELPPFHGVTEDDIAFLKKTRRARIGQEDEWKIACDLVGQPHIRIPEIRKLVLE